MEPYYKDEFMTLYHADIVEALRSIPEKSVDSVVTSPPYAMQRKTTYGGIPEKDYPEWTVTWMKEVRRVLKDDGSVLLNISPHRSKGDLADYVLRTRLALREDGWIEPDELIWHKPNAMPGGPPSRPRRVWEHIFWFAKDEKAWSDPYAAGTPQKELERGKKAYKTSSPAKRNGWDHKFGSGKSEIRDVARVTNVATFAKARKTGFEHPAPFPVALAEWCGKLITPEGGVILDPFAGSSSTGVAALQNGWRYIGIDSVEEYVEMSKERLLKESETLVRPGAALAIE